MPTTRIAWRNTYRMAARWSVVWICTQNTVPFSTEDEGKYLEYAMIAEEKKGNGMGLKLWPDATRLKDKRGRQWRVFLRRLGYDESTVMQLYPMCQGFNGGILLKDDLTTDIEGLFACGESSGGLHGPDRMGGLCILATQVFGEAAGRALPVNIRQKAGPSSRFLPMKRCEA